MRLLTQLNARLAKLESIMQDDDEDGDTFEDSMVGPVLDDSGRPILDVATLRAMGYSAMT